MCSITPSLRSLVTERVRQAIEDKYASDGKFYPEYAQAEIAGMQELQQIVTNIKNGQCCDIIPPDLSIDDWLIAEGFEKLDINCNVVGPIVASRKNSSSLEKSNGTYVQNMSNLEVEINGNSVDFDFSLNELLNVSAANGSSLIFFIIDSENICNGDYDFAKQEILSNLPHLGGIVYIQDLDDSPDAMYVKLEGLEVENFPASFADFEEGTLPPSGGSSGFQELVDLVREAEDSLIKHGRTSLHSRLIALRGIYYGTDWSMDFNQSYGTATRNTGFNLYLCGTVPFDPRPILGTTLFEKLYSSPEVINGSLGVDWGHIIIGLEARFQACSREVNFLFHLSKGLEITTWIGDGPFA